MKSSPSDLEPKHPKEELSRAELENLPVLTDKQFQAYYQLSPEVSKQLRSLPKERRIPFFYLNPFSRKGIRFNRQKTDAYFERNVEIKELLEKAKRA